MNMKSRIKPRTVRLSCTILVGILLPGLVGSFLRTANANHVSTHYLLVDNNTKWDIDPALPDTVSKWIIGGKDHVQEISNWFRVGNSGPEAPLSSLNILSVTPGDEDFDSGGDDHITVVYESPGLFELEVKYGVLGSGNGASGGCTNCFTRIKNLQSNSLDLHLFQYWDLDLDGSAGNDNGLRTSATSFMQSDNVSSTTFNMTFAANHYEGALAPFTRNRLTNGTATTLNDMPLGTYPPVGSGDVTWALQYDYFLPAGNVGDEYFFICLPNLLETSVPEPTSSALIVIAGTALIVARRRRCGAR